MKQKPLSPAIFGIFSCSILYWIYLALHTHMVMECDAIGYEQLGRLLKDHGFVAYFQTGPNREPVYPLLVALSMHVEAFSGIAYTKIMAFFGVFLLLCSQILTYIILRKMNVRPLIVALVLAYMGLSPALNNTAFSLYSEIAAIPFILLLTLMTANCFENITTNKPFQNLLAGIALGLLFFVITMVKSIFELIFFIFVGLYLILLLKAFLQNNKKILLNCSIFLITFFTIYEIPIHAYKMLNETYNHHYALTNRGSWALYGGCALKTEPLTMQKSLTALAHVPGKGACAKFFSEDECAYWEPNYTSDSLGMAEMDKVSKTTLPRDVDAVLLSNAKARIIQHPIQFSLLSSLDWIKMFFWESTKIGFVDYPLWLTNLYNKSILKDGLRLFTSLLSLCAFLWLVVFIKNPLRLFDLKGAPSTELWLRFSMFMIILSYTGFHALFNTIPRWALPIAPLYLISIGYVLEQLLHQPKNKNHSS